MPSILVNVSTPAALTNAGYFRLVREMYEPRPGTAQSVAGPREYERRFLVYTNKIDVGPKVVCDNAPGLPNLYASYQSGDGTEADIYALMYEKRAVVFGGDPYLWVVTCRYTTRIDQFATTDDPEAEQPQFEWDTENTQQALQKDLDGKPIANSAHQPYTPAPTFDVPMLVLSLTRNENIGVNDATYGRARYTKWVNTINSDVFMGARVDCAHIHSIRATQQVRGLTSFFRVTYRIRFWPGVDGSTSLGSWQPEILDAGLCRLQLNPLAPALSKPVPIIRPGGPITQPVLLDGDGQEAVPVGGTITPVYNKHKVYRRNEFARLLDRRM